MDLEESDGEDLEDVLERSAAHVLAEVEGLPQPLPRGPKTFIFKSRARMSSLFGVETAIFIFKTHQPKWGAKPPHLR